MSVSSALHDPLRQASAGLRLSPAALIHFRNPTPFRLAFASILTAQFRVLPDRIFQSKAREYGADARPICPESRLEVIPMRRDELMKPDSLSEVLLVVAGLLLVLLIMVGIDAVIG